MLQQMGKTFAVAYPCFLCGRDDSEGGKQASDSSSSASSFMNRANVALHC